MGALDALIYGVRDVFGDAVQLARRARISFGPEFELVDDPVNEWTRVAVKATALKGNTSGILPNTANVVQWAPSSTSSVVGYTIAGTAATVDATPTAMALITGTPAIVVDDADFVLQAAALVSVRKPADGLAEFFRVSRCFKRDGGGAVAAIDAQSDDGSAPSSPTLTLPAIAWDTATKLPKITVTGDAGPDTLFWRAVMAIAVFKDPG